MRITVTFILGLLMFMAGCSSSQQTAKPKTIDSYKQLTPEEAAKVLRDAEAQQPCSEQNLKNASAEQKAKCNPTQGVFEHIKPTQPTNERKQQPAHLKATGATN